MKKAESPSCGVITARSRGQADAGASPSTPAVGAVLAGSDWLELERDTEIVLRHSTTTRELALRGPGRFLPCFLGTETVLVAHGTVVTTAGAGARAGAEVILAAPLGLLHFADAALELDVGKRSLKVKVTTGSAALVSATNPGRDAGPDEYTLGPKSERALRGSVEPESLVARCSEASRRIQATPPSNVHGAASARALAKEWAVGQLRARRDARWACAVARAAAGRLDGPERHRLWDQLAAFDEVWHAAPAFGWDAGK